MVYIAIKGGRGEKIDSASVAGEGRGGGGLKKKGGGKRAVLFGPFGPKQNPFFPTPPFF